MSHLASTLMGDIARDVRTAFIAAFPQLDSDDFAIEVARTESNERGHYQCNSAMKLAKQLGLSPRAIAEKAVAGMPLLPLYASFEVAGPGFINIRLATQALGERVEALAHQPSLGLQCAVRRRVVVDFSSPNTAKEMHVGHLRSTVIGDAIARTLEAIGYDVKRLNHIGDWGTSFGMLIANLKGRTPQAVEQMTLSDLVASYREAKKQFDEDAEFKKRSQLEVVALQTGEPEARRVWEVICAVSRKAYQEIYDLLDITLEERGESFYNPYLASTVQELEQKGLVTLSEGAKCIFLEGFVNREGEPLPLMVQKSDGGYNYDTTDMAAMGHRIREEKADWIIIVTDAGQATHFAQIFMASRLAEIVPPTAMLSHVPFGVVLGSDGKKFRTRSGETERLMDLLTTAVDKAEAIFAERSPELTEEERKQMAKVLGLGAVKYADLSSHRMSDYTFSYDRMLRFEGNTVAFVMYAYVRAQGIKRKIGPRAEELLKEARLHLDHLSEIALALKLAQFPEAIEAMLQELLPNRLTDYLYTLAESFNVFFRDCRVEGSEQEASRLLLAETTTLVLARGLNLLGIQILDRM